MVGGSSRLLAAEERFKNIGMDFSLFQKIVQEGREVGVEHLHLQGWGEPLLHPRFLDMVLWTNAV